MTTKAKPNAETLRELVLAACGDYGGNDGLFSADYFRSAVAEMFDMPPPSREWAAEAIGASGLAETLDDGFMWRLRNVRGNRR